MDQQIRKQIEDELKVRRLKLIFFSGLTIICLGMVLFFIILGYHDSSMGRLELTAYTTVVALIFGYIIGDARRGIFGVIRR